MTHQPTINSFFGKSQPRIKVESQIVIDLDDENSNHQESHEKDEGSQNHQENQNDLNESTNSVRVCKECGSNEKYHGHGFCRKCYYQLIAYPKKLKKVKKVKKNSCTPLTKLCIKCEKMKPFYAKGMCKACYQRLIAEPKRREKKMREERLNGEQSTRIRPLKLCIECGETKPHHAKGMCNYCYHRLVSYPNWCKKKLEERLKKKKGTKRMGSNLSNADHQLSTSQEIAQTTTSFSHKKPSPSKEMEQLVEPLGHQNLPKDQKVGKSTPIGYLKKCVECKELKPHKAKGMCRYCYHRLVAYPRWYKKKYGKRLEVELKSRSTKSVDHLRLCIECGELKPHEARGMCRQCYERLIIRPKRREQRLKTHENEQLTPIRPLKLCIECGEMKPHKAKGMCFQCYSCLVTEPRRREKRLKKKKSTKNLKSKLPNDLRHSTTQTIVQATKSFGHENLEQSATPLDHQMPSTSKNPDKSTKPSQQHNIRLPNQQQSRVNSNQRAAIPQINIKYIELSSGDENDDQSWEY